MLRAIFSTSDPMEALHNLKTKYSYKFLMEYLEYLDAKETMEESSVEVSGKIAEQKKQQQSRASL